TVRRRRHMPVKDPLAEPERLLGRHPEENLHERDEQERQRRERRHAKDPVLYTSCHFRFAAGQSAGAGPASLITAGNHHGSRQARSGRGTGFLPGKCVPVPGSSTQSTSTNSKSIHPAVTTTTSKPTRSWPAMPSEARPAPPSASSLALTAAMRSGICS